MTQIDKNILRSSHQAARQHLGADARNHYSRQICQQLLEIIRIRQPSCLLAYKSLASEVGTGTLFEHPSTPVYAPVTHNHQHMEWRHANQQSEWETGVFGVQEPVNGQLWTSASGTTILACPLVAFDRAGNRLGMGKGCFDFWLAQHHHAIDMVIGLAFSCQETAAIPAEAHDMPMNCIITETEVINV